MKRSYTLLILLCCAGNLLLNAQAPAYAWLKQATGGSDVFNTGVAVDNVNHFVYVTGTFQGNYINFGSDVHSNLNPSSGSNDIFLVKYTTSGQYVWSKTFGGLNSDQSTGIAVDPWGNVIIGGVFGSDTIWFGNTFLVNVANTDLAPVNDAFLAKFDANGNTLWAKLGACNADTGISYVSPAGSYTVATDAQGNAYLEGSFRGTVTFDTKVVSTARGACIYAVKVDTGGTVKWATQSISLNTNLNPGSAIAEAIAIDNAGSPIIAGWYSDDVQFGTQQFGGSDSYTSRFQSKLSAADGSYTWTTLSRWAQFDGENNYGVATDNAGNSFYTGLISDSLNRPNFFLEKRNTSGDVVWIIHDTMVFTVPVSVATDANGNSYFSMVTTDTLFSFGGQTLLMPAGSLFGIASYINSCPIVIKADANGNVQWIKGVTPSLNSQMVTNPGSITVDNSGYIYTSGSIADTCGFDGFSFGGDPSNGDLYISRLGGPVEAVANVLPDDGLVNIYPNPSSGQVHFHFAQLTGKVQVHITNITGQEIDALEMENTNDVIWNVSGKVAAGTYLCTFVYHTSGLSDAVTTTRLAVIY